MDKRKLEDCLARLDALRQIKDGWRDGHGVQPSDEVLDKVELILKCCSWLPKVAYIYPMGNEGEGVQLEWEIELDDCTELHELDVQNNGTVRYWYFLDVEEDSGNYCADVTWEKPSYSCVVNTLDFHHGSDH